MSDFTVVPWSKYGKKRLYVKTADGREIGYVDLLTGAVVATIDGFTAELAAIASEHLDGCATSPPNTDQPAADCPPLQPVDDPNVSPTSDKPQPDPNFDVSANAPGAAARAKRKEVNAQAPICNLLARLLGVKTEERAWRVGAKGEEKIGKELTKLPEGWHVLHAVQVSDAGTDIDHVVMGPAGVFTLNTKRHPHGKVTVYEQALYVSGAKVDYLQKSRSEACRASRLLGDACGFPVPVRSAIVFVDLADIKEKGRPENVLVTTRRRLTDLLRSLPVSLSSEEVSTIYEHACSSRTWRSAPRPSSASG